MGEEMPFLERHPHPFMNLEGDPLPCGLIGSGLEVHVIIPPMLKPCMLVFDKYSQITVESQSYVQISSI